MLYEVITGKIEDQDNHLFHIKNLDTAMMKLYSAGEEEGL